MRTMPSRTKFKFFKFKLRLWWSLFDLRRRMVYPPSNSHQNVICFWPHHGTRYDFLPIISSLLTQTNHSKRQTVRLHDVDANVLRSKYTHSEPVLDGCFGIDASYVFTGGLDSIVKMHHFESGNEDTLGRHEKAVRCLEHCNDLNVTVSGSWDGTVKLWDIREKTPLVGDFQQKGKVFTMSLAGTKLVVGTSGSHIDVWDLRDTKEPLQERKSPLKHMTRVIRWSPNHEGFALGSVEGRVAIEHFASEKKKSNYAFKCHRKKDADGNTIVYPVNALSFHPTYVVYLYLQILLIEKISNPSQVRNLCKWWMRRYSSNLGRCKQETSLPITTTSDGYLLDGFQCRRYVTCSCKFIYLWGRWEGRYFRKCIRTHDKRRTSSSEEEEEEEGSCCLIVCVCMCVYIFLWNI